jgi:hypothetical protein
MLLGSGTARVVVKFHPITSITCSSTALKELTTPEVPNALKGSDDTLLSQSWTSPGDWQLKPF